MTWVVIIAAVALGLVFVAGWFSQRPPAGPIGPSKAELDLQSSFDAKRRAELTRIDSLDKGGVLEDLNRDPNRPR